MEQCTNFGLDSISCLSNILASYCIEKVFLVCDKLSYKLCGAKERMEDILSDTDVCLFDDFKANPRLFDVRKGIKKFKEYGKIDCIIAVGGGTAIDMAKLINILAHQPYSPLEIIRHKKQVEKHGILFIAIPTTAGTGSEATHFAVVYVGRKKYSLAHEFILPDIAIIDPTFHFP